jgi:hypothetical protein
LRSILLIIISLNDLFAIRISFLQNSTCSTIADIMSSSVHAISIFDADEILLVILVLSVILLTNLIMSSQKTVLYMLTYRSSSPALYLLFLALIHSDISDK